MTRRLAVALLVVFGAPGCLPPPPAGTSLEAATPAPVSLTRGAWLAQATISDPHAQGASETQRGLTLAIASHLGDAKYFTRVNLLPGEPATDELILRFDFERYQLRRTTHPLYFPAAILTLTVYIWAGGPIGRSEASFSGSLIVEDTRGVQLVRVDDHFELTHNVDAYSSDFIFASGAKARTTLVRTLTEKAIAELARPPLTKESP